MKKMMSRKVLGYIALALVCVLAGTALGMTQQSASADTVVLTSPFTEAIAKVRDSVVGVYNYQIVNNNSYGFGGSFGGPSGGPGFGGGYGYGNGGNQQESEVKYASGSGTVIAREYVLTNYHVIEGHNSLKISVGGDDSNLYEASVAAYDSDKDIAVLYVPGLPCDPVELGDSDQLQVGDWAINIGNAIGFTGTVTAGIISGLDREIESDTTTRDRYGRMNTVVNTMIQTDAAINSGNSGGGMFNTAGQLVGIPTLKYSGTRYSSGASVESIGMCIPINDAKDLISQALNGSTAQNSVQNSASGDNETTVTMPTEENAAQQNTGRTGKPRLGVTVTSLNTNGELPNGAYIVSVEAGSPAETAGLQPGDIIVELNGQVVSSTSELMNGLEPFQVGDVVNITVWRPDIVQDAEQGMISYDGQYVENIHVSLAMLDNIAQ